PPTPPRFPYTTLFRSIRAAGPPARIPCTGLTQFCFPAKIIETHDNFSIGGGRFFGHGDSPLKTKLLDSGSCEFDSKNEILDCHQQSATARTESGSHHSLWQFGKHCSTHW